MRVLCIVALACRYASAIYELVLDEPLEPIDGEVKAEVAPNFQFLEEWQVLGPFPIGTRGE
jgi:ABC-type sulfate/molybdate transport systems ATPase subunit